MQRCVRILDLRACMCCCLYRTAPGFCCLNNPRPQNRSKHYQVLRPVLSWVPFLWFSKTAPSLGWEKKDHLGISDRPSCLSMHHAFCLQRAFVSHVQYRGGHCALTIIFSLPHPPIWAFHPGGCKGRTAHGDLLAVAGGDVADVWQLLEVLPGLVQEV